MVREADQYRKSDERRRDEQEIRNKADQQIYQAMRMGQDARGLVEERLIQTVNSAAANLTNALNNFDPESARKGLEVLNSELMILSKAFYDAKSGGGSAGRSEPARAAQSAPQHSSLTSAVQALGKNKSATPEDVDSDLSKLAEILEKHQGPNDVIDVDFHDI